MKYGDGKTKGCRLADPRDPATRQALARKCPECYAEPDQWCCFATGRPGRRRSRLHFARAQFQDIT